MNRYSDIKLRAFTLCIPALFPIVAVYVNCKIIVLGLYNTICELWACNAEAVKELLDFKVYTNYCKSLYHVFFDWEIGSPLKPRNEEYERRLRERERRWFGKELEGEEEDDNN